MSQLTLSQARVVDPVLTSIAQGYKQSAFVGGALFPQVPVSLRAGNVITFGREDFMLYNTARAPGEATRRVQFGYSGNPFALVDYSLEGALPIENLQEGLAGSNGWSIDGAALAIAKTLDIMALRLEYAQAVLATTAANYAAGNKNVGLTGTSLWSDFTGTSDPIANVETGKEAIRSATGKRPNTIVMGPSVASKLRQHPKVVDRIKYTGRDVATNELLAMLFIGVGMVSTVMPKYLTLVAIHKPLGIAILALDELRNMREQCDDLMRAIAQRPAAAFNATPDRASQPQAALPPPSGRPAGAVWWPAPAPARRVAGARAAPPRSR